MAINIGYSIAGDPTSNCGTGSCGCDECVGSNPCADSGLYDGIGIPIPTTLYATISCPGCPAMDGQTATLTFTYISNENYYFSGSVVVCDYSITIEVGCFYRVGSPPVLIKNFEGCLYLYASFPICTPNYSTTTANYDPADPDAGTLTVNSSSPVDLTFSANWTNFSTGPDPCVPGLVSTCCGGSLHGVPITIEITE